MNLLRKICLTGALALSVVSLANASINDLPVKTIGGKNYYYYEVQPKETIYSLCKRWGVTKEYIFEYNPSAADGLRANSILLFPVEGDAAEDSTAMHTVVKGETIYEISMRYGISTDQLMTWNPETRQGLKVGQQLIVSDPQSPSKAPKAATETSDYTIRTGESLYRIAIDHNTTVDRLLALNPDLNENHYRAGQIIKVPSSGAEIAVADNNTPVKMISHTVTDKETFYSIARRHGITVSQLEEANPGIGSLKAGQILYIPIYGDSDAAAPAVTTFVAESPVTVANEVDPTDIASDADVTEVLPVNEIPGTTPGELPIALAPEISRGTIDIAIALPFMLAQEEQPRQAQLYTEFYKGFLLAVDSMRRCGKPINIHTFDTAGSIDTVRSILSRPELKEVQLIISPENESHLAEFARFGRDNNVKILNVFVVKDDTQKLNSAVMQGNIPHEDMYSKAIDGMLSRFEGYIPVILTRTDGPDDKKEFIAELKSELNEKGIDFKEIEFGGQLSVGTLGGLDLSERYAFIGTSGKQAEVNNIIEALSEFKYKLEQPDAMLLFGYPEWTTFRGETLSNMHSLNTVVYSRFYSSPDDADVNRVEQVFNRWYGTPMANYMPRQGLLGFDTGMFVIDTILTNEGDFDKASPEYNGVQNGFHFVRRPGEFGWINDKLYLINYRPSGMIERISL